MILIMETPVLSKENPPYLKCYVVINKYNNAMA